MAVPPTIVALLQECRNAQDWKKCSRESNALDTSEDTSDDFTLVNRR